MSQTVTVIGSGFSSLAAACYLAKAGYEVTILEKNEHVGGRARKLTKEGFSFDMGPSFYWMPDIFERFFGDFDKSPSVYYDLKKLDPAYSVYFSPDERVTIGGNLEDIHDTFESIEKGSSKHLKNFMNVARDNYDIAIKDLVYRPGNSPLELVTKETVTRLDQFLSTIDKRVRANIKNEKLRRILEFPVLFLGAKPSKTPAFYNFMNYADFGLGTWHPKGGMTAVSAGMEMLAYELGVKIHTGVEVKSLITVGSRVVGVQTDRGEFKSSIVLSGADYHHTETLLPEKLRAYSESYWKRKTFAPSSLLFYIAFDKKLKNIDHHTLFFDTDFNSHASAIYDKAKWPNDPMFYCNFPSVTDDTFAPKGKESATVLIPIAPGIEDTNEIREKYFNIVIDRLEQNTGQDLKDQVRFYESFCVNDFVNDYHSYGGNAYGLANTLLQTAFLRPKIKSKKAQGLYFTGQLTVPGPGVPPALISGKIVADQILKNEHHSNVLV